MSNKSEFLSCVAYDCCTTCMLNCRAFLFFLCATVCLKLVVCFGAVKMPQLIKIVQHSSAYGLSYTSELLMLIVSMTGVSYNILRQYPVRFVCQNWY